MSAGHDMWPKILVDSITTGGHLQTIAPSAHHLDGTLEYDAHNLYGHNSAMATWRALESIYPDRRPFTLTRYKEQVSLTQSARCCDGTDMLLHDRVVNPRIR